MRVILDTNVLISALMVSDGPAHQLYEAFLNDRFTLISSDTQIEEFSRVTRYPAIRARIRPAQAGSMLNAVRSLSVFLEKLSPASISRDPHDDYLFAMAKAGEADYLVTGDKSGVLALRGHGKTKIVTVRRLVAVLDL